MTSFFWPVINIIQSTLSVYPGIALVKNCPSLCKESIQLVGKTSRRKIHIEDFYKVIKKPHCILSKFFFFGYDPDLFPVSNAI